jgi:hypothetical protein
MGRRLERMRVSLNRKSGRLFLLAVAIAVLVKLWLTAEIRIEPIYGPHDALNFVQHAKQIVAGNWFGKYSDMTLIKGPSFQLFLALIDELGIPLPLAHQLLCAIASFVACMAVRPVVRSWKGLAFIFTVLFFNPFTFSQSAWAALRSQINDSMALLALACATALFVRRKAPARASVPWLLGLGVSFAVFSFTREESIWLLPGIVAVVALYLWSTRKQQRPVFLRRVAYCAIPVAVWFGYWGTLATLNGVKYGWYTVVEMTSREYVSAYGSLARIIPAHPLDRLAQAHNPSGHYADIGVPLESRRIAYGVSPAARELEPALEGGSGKEWTRISCSVGYSCTDIPSGWFVWAFRDAVAIAGHYRTGADARAFYLRLAAEIDQACDTGRIRCRPKGHTLAPPITPGDIPRALANFADGVRVSATFALLTTQPWPKQQPAAQTLQDYQSVTRDVDLPGGIVYYGWLVDDGLRSLAVRNAEGGEVPANITFSISPDVYAALSRGGHRPPRQAGLSRFTIATACADGCSLMVTDDAKTPVRIPLGVATPAFTNSRLEYHLDDAIPMDEEKGVGSARPAALAEIAHTYQAVMPYWIVVVAGFTIFRAARARRKRRAFGIEHVVLTLGMLLATGALIAILALITAISFLALTEDYMIGIPALLLYALAVATAFEGRIVWIFVKRLVPAHAAVQSGTPRIMSESASERRPFQ